mgnify:CR=1 FL=1
MDSTFIVDSISNFSSQNIRTWMLLAIIIPTIVRVTIFLYIYTFKFRKIIPEKQSIKALKLIMKLQIPELRIYIKNEGWLNPHLFINNLESILANHPAVQFIDDSIFRIEGDKSIQSFIGEKGHRYQGDTYMLATGATISKILDKSESNLNIQQVFYGVGVSAHNS